MTTNQWKLLLLTARLLFTVIFFDKEIARQSDTFKLFVNHLEKWKHEV